MRISGKRRSAVIAAGLTAALGVAGASRAGTIVTLASFSSINAYRPSGVLLADAAGNLYGTTQFGGSGTDGTIFEVPAGSNTIVTLASFNSNTGNTPRGGLIADAAGNFYGTTSSGGTGDDGTIFKLPAGSNTISALAPFTGGNGADPAGPLISDAAGNLYGTTLSGGDANGDGAIFKLANGASTITPLALFNGTNGATPSSGVIADAAGNLYGTTESGGTGQGTIFKLAKGSSTITPLASFNGGNAGLDTYGGLLADSAGDFYGVSAGGGADSDGAVYELQAGSMAAKALAPFDDANGNYSSSGLIADTRGDLFGTASLGGTSEDGVVFEVPADSNTIVVVASFNGKNGAYPASGLIADAQGNLYGVTGYGGPTWSNVSTAYTARSSKLPIAALSSRNRQVWDC